MKKLYYLLLALPLAFFASCDNDDDLPEVDITVEMSGGMVSDGVIYMVQGDTLTVDGITVKSLTDKPATTGATTYFWDYRPTATVIAAPYTMEFDTALTPVGNHLLQIQTGVYQVDKSAAFVTMSYKVTVVKSAEDIPSGATPMPEGPQTPENPTIKAQ